MNSLVSYIMLPENGKMASTVSPFQVLKISPENHFSVEADFRHSCRFTVCMSAIPEIQQLTTAFPTYTLKLDLNKWSICVPQVCAKRCVFYPTSVMSGLLLTKKEVSTNASGNVYKVPDTIHQLSFRQALFQVPGTKVNGTCFLP